MARSLDGLIRHLVDQIALCGEYGESTRFPIVSVRAIHASRFHCPLCIFPRGSIMSTENPTKIFPCNLLCLDNALQHRLFL